MLSAALATTSAGWSSSRAPSSMMTACCGHCVIRTLRAGCIDEFQRPPRRAEDSALTWSLSLSQSLSPSPSV